MPSSSAEQRLDRKTRAGFWPQRFSVDLAGLCPGIIEICIFILSEVNADSTRAGWQGVAATVFIEFTLEPETSSPQFGRHSDTVCALYLHRNSPSSFLSLCARDEECVLNLRRSSTKFICCSVGEVLYRNITLFFGDVFLLLLLLLLLYICRFSF